MWIKTSDLVFPPVSRVMGTDSWSTQGSGWTRSKCLVCDVFLGGMVSSSSLFFGLRSGLLDPGALVSIGETRLANLAVLSEVAAIRGSPSRVAEWVETIPVALPRAWLLQGRRPTSRIAVSATRHSCSSVTVVHFVENIVADALQLHGAGAAASSRAAGTPRSRRAVPHSTGFQTMPLSLVATVGPIGIRVQDCTETWRPTLKLLRLLLAHWIVGCLRAAFLCPSWSSWCVGHAWHH